MVGKAGCFLCPNAMCGCGLGSIENGISAILERPPITACTQYSLRSSEQAARTCAAGSGLLSCVRNGTVGDFFIKFSTKDSHGGLLVAKMTHHKIGVIE